MSDVGRQEPQAIPRRPRDGAPLALSFAQQRLWFLDQLDPGSPLHHVWLAVRLEGQLDGAALEQAFGALAARHETLRTTFRAEAGRPLQVIAPEAKVALTRVDLGDVPPGEREAWARRSAEEELRRPFDITAGPLLRATLLRLGEDQHVLVLVAHALVADLRSLRLLLEEAQTLSGAFAAGRPLPSLPELPLQYADFAAWQRERLQGQGLQAQLDYWRGQLSGAPPALELPADHPRPAAPSLRAAHQPVEWPHALSERLTALCLEEGTTLSEGLMAAFQLLLSRHSGQDDLCVGFPVSGRSQPGLERLVGPFAHPLVVRVRLEPTLTFRRLLGRVREAMQGALAHQELPFERLLHALQPARSFDRPPLFQTMLVLDGPAQPAPHGAPPSPRPFELSPGAGAADLTLWLTPGAQGLTGAFGYDAGLFEPGTVARLAGHLRVLLEAAVAHPDQRLSALPLLTAPERHQVLVEWNDTRANFPRDALVPQRFEAQAARAPNAVAVVSGDEQLTYGELNRRANRLAHHLRARGVGPDVQVGLCLERSPDLVVGLLGILKAGGAYVPLDPSLPRERLASMLQDSAAPLLLTQQRLAGRGLPAQVQVLCLDSDAALFSSHGEHDPAPLALGDNLAYVIYTSGSTGRPKGVMVQHRSVLHLHHALARTVYAGQPTPLRVSLNAPLSFDASVQQVVQLLDGHCLCIVPEQTRRDPAALLDWLERQRVDVFDCTPSVLRLLLEAGLLERKHVPRILLPGGEAIDETTWDRLARTDRTRAFNVYGPTECTVDSTAFCLQGANGRPVIGHPLSNVQAYVLDAHLQPLPPGVPGELYLGGEGVARGYQGRPDLTAEHFIPHPFSAEPGARLYRTGDGMRRLPDGRLEYLGRLDHQVKVRGFRIELGEIEVVLAQYPPVGEAVVVVREDVPGDRRLVAYVVPRKQPGPGAGALRAHLKVALPEYMVPTAFVELSALPRTPNGKVDRKALPSPDADRPESGPSFVAPRTPTEERVAAVWSELLGLERVNVHGDFFALGGDSLLLPQVLARLRSAFGVELPLRTLFELPTVAQLTRRLEETRARQLLAHARQAPDNRREGPVARPPGAPLLLSPVQERLWFLHQLQPDSPVYHVPAAVELTGPLAADALERGLRLVFERHQILRTAIRAHEGGPAPFTCEVSASLLPLEDLSSAPDAEDVLPGRLREEARRPFDVARGPLLRARLLRLGVERHVLAVVAHALVADAPSLDLLLREVLSLAGASSAGRPAPALPRLPLQYADFAAWQREQLQDEALTALLDYWRKQLSGAPAALELPTDFPRPPVQSFRGARHPLTLPRALADRLLALAREEGAPLSVALMAAFQLILSRYSGQDDLCVGFPVPARGHPSLEGLIGPFSNPLVVRARPAGSLSYRQLLRHLHQVMREAEAHQQLPFERLVHALEPARTFGRAPLFQAMLVLQDAPALTPGGEPLPFSARPLDVDTGAEELDLTLCLTQGAHGLTGTLRYDAGLFQPETIARLAGHLRVLLEAAVADPDRPSDALPLLTAPERHQLLVDWADARFDFPRTCLHALFEAQVERTPDAPALLWGDERLTYRELDVRANRLAWHLRSRGAGPEVRVGLCLERSPDLVVGLLAILKAGGAYVPLDPAYPRERLSFMLEDSGAKLLVTREALRTALGPSAAVPVLLDAESGALAGGPATPPSGTGITPEHLAYVIYTSGSTGRPKGVALEHRSAAAFLHWARGAFTPGQLSRVLAATSVCFDLSIFELFAPLSCGGAVVLAENALALPSLPAAREVTLVNTVPSAIAELIRAGGLPDSVRTVNLAGEPLPGALVRELYRTSAVEQVFNLYGPTEDTTYSTWALAARDARREPTIGRALPGTAAYILDSRMQPQPQGVPGELYLAGAGLARGYLGRPELTAERFVPHPFGEPGARLYRTGDRARLLPDGELEYLGRMDHQVKVRGFRIELGEIEVALRTHPALEAAVAVVREDSPGDRRLVAYVVPKTPPGPGVGALRAHLKETLPEYMVPSAFVELAALPLNPNGKVDRKALPAPDAAGPLSPDGPFTAPRTPTEVLLAGMWSELLGVKRVDVHGDFFELGGHSLLATQVVSRLRGAFGVELPLRALFEAPSVEGLARRVDEARAQALPGTEAGARPGPGAAAGAEGPTRRPPGAPLHPSPAQERMWFFMQLRPESPAYNEPRAVELTRPPDVPALEAALRLLLERHPVLRSVFPAAQGRPTVALRDIPARVLAVEDVTSAADPQALLQRHLAEEAQRPFHLEHGPLCRFLLFKAPGRHVLLLAFHHIVMDGWSLEVLWPELSLAYEAFTRGESPRLPPLPLDYFDVASWLRSDAVAARDRAQLDHWTRTLEGAPALLELPTDFPRPPVLGDSGALTPRLRLPPSLLQDLQAFCRQQRVTPFMALYAGLVALLHRYSQQADFCIGTLASGRTHLATEHLFGLFINSLALRARPHAELPFSELVAQARQTTLDAFAHQDVPLERIVDALHVPRSLSHTPLFHVMFDLLREQSSLAQSFAPLGARTLQLKGGATEFDLAFRVVEDAAGFEAYLVYNTGLYEAATAQRMLDHYVQLLAHALKAPETPLGRLALLEAGDRRRVLVDFNATPARFDEAATLVSLFDAVAARHPDALAVVARDQSLTFRELKGRAQSLASHLAALGAGPESVVGVCLERDSELLVSLLAVLYSGAAYLPLEPSHPPARRAQVLARSGARLLLSRPALFPGVELDLRLVDPHASGPAASPRPPVPANVAYVLYTSGSTGEPKGVEVTHRNLAHAYAWFDRDFDTRPGSRWLAVTSVGFDVHALDTLYPLTRGATVVLRETGPAGLLEDLARHDITHLNLPPAFYPLLREEASALDRFHRLSVLIVGGASIDPQGVELAPPHGGMFNCYGPTETTLLVSHHRLRPGAPLRIGKPGDRTRFYVLDPNGEPVPPGVPGELYVGGEGVSRGYRHRPDLTAERFVPDPFSPEPGARLYRTGDRVKWHADGTASFLGRTDFQVKVRGVRIELEEVEATLRRVSGIRQAAVLARKHEGDTRLLAFVSVEPGLSAPRLKDAVAGRLPDAMVPSRFIVLDALPLTSNNKVDRKALAALPLEEEALQAGEPPRTQAEQLVAQLISQLLGLERAGRDDNFFQLGGHSLSAVQLLSRVRQAFGVELPLAALFSAPSVAALARLLEHSQAPAATLQGPTPRPPGAPLLLSPAQERMWFLHQLQPDSSAYHIPDALELAGPLSTDALEKSLRLLLDRHRVLCTALRVQDGRPVATFCEPPTPLLAHEDLSSAPDAEALLQRRLREEARRPFDFERGPLCRFHLFRMAPERHVLLLSYHHLVTDGISVEILRRELSSAYTALQRGLSASLPAAAVDYADVAAWLRSDAVAARDQAQLQHWTRQLEGAPTLLELPTDFPRPAVLSDRGALTPRLRLPPLLSRELHAFCRRQQLTPFMALYAGFVALLYRYSQQTDFCLGTPTSGRTHLATESVVGLFVNSLVLRARPHAELSFSGLLDQARQTTLDAFAHQDVPFERLVDALHVPRSLSHTPLFQVMFDLYREETAVAQSLAALGARPLPAETGTSKFDLSFSVVEDASGFEVYLEHSSDLYEAATARRMLSHYVQLLSHALEAPATPLSRLPLLDAAERQNVLTDFNATSAPFDEGATLATLFDAQAHRRPDAVAVLAGDRALALGELQARARRLAGRLAALGAGPGSVVGLCLEREPELLVSLLAIVYSGAAYLPLEPSHPPARRAELLSRSGACLLVSRPSLFPGVALDLPRVAPEDEGPQAPVRPPSPEDVACLLYTSGSTGEPKGVELTHRNLVHAFAAFDALYDTRPGDCWTASASISFDMHLEELLYSLTRGARIVLREVGPRDLARDILRHRATHAVTTPSSLAAALEEEGALEAFRSLRVLVSGGEALPDALVRQLDFSTTRLLNTYGPSETSINVTGQLTLPGRPVHLGRPLDRVRLYVVDPHGEPLPVGVPGELYVGGEGVGRGYRLRPALTAERFVPDPFSPTPGARLYRTGDRVKWHPDGTLGFLGRTDFQVKVRGVRIELEEVEAALLRAPGVRQAAVLARKHRGDTRLLGFVALEPSTSAPRLEASLSSQLPDAMVPSRLVVLDALPLTSSGKVDRKALAALPVPEDTTAGAAPPQGPFEELLAQVFCQLLQLERVGRDDDFFSLGGHSLSAVQLLSRVRQAFGIELPLTALFALPTLAGLAALLERAQVPAATLDGPTPRLPGAPLLLSPAQERMWFLHQLQPDSSAWHVPDAFELSGPLSARALEESLRLLVERHRVLRIAIRARDGSPVPSLGETPAELLPLEDLSSEPEPDSLLQRRLREESRRPFDFERGPLYRFRLFRLSPERHVLLLAYHHLVIDGLSADVLSGDLSAAYAALSSGRAPSLPALPLEYADVAAWLRSDAVAARDARQLGYWTRQLEGAPAFLALPTDFPRPAIAGDRSALAPRLRLPLPLAQTLQAFCRQHQATPFMALYAGFVALLYRYSGQTDLCIGTPSSGRTHLATEGVVGLFVNSLVLRSRLRADLPFLELLAQARQTTLDAFSHQDVPFERLVDALHIPRSLGHTPLFQVTFSWQVGATPPSLDGLQARALEVDTGGNGFDLTLALFEADGTLDLSLAYSTDLYEAQTAQRLLSDYVQLLSHALEAPTTPLAQLRPLDAGDRRGAPPASLSRLPPEPDVPVPGQPPRGQVEELLAQVFCQLLQLERVARDDDFFSLGGHSLSAVQLVSRIRQAFGVELPLATVFSAPSVAALARLLERAQAPAATLDGPTPRPPGAPLLLSPAQERMWFLHQLQPDSSAWHVPDAFELSGPLSARALEESLRLLVERHRVLRTVLRAEDGSPVPSLGEAPAEPLPLEDLSSEPEPDSLLQRRLREESRRPFDFERGPLYRFRLFRLSPERHVLLLAYHHLVIDGLSIDVLRRELSATYAALSSGRAPSLPALPLDYADVAAWLRSAAVAARDARQLDYWTRQLEGAPALLALPTDFPRPAVLGAGGAATPRLRLPSHVLRALRALCRQQQVTPFMALCAGFTALLYRYSQQSDFCIGTPSSGRTHLATEGVVGLFVNSLVLRSRPHADLPFSEWVALSRATTLEAFSHQDVPFERLVDALHVPRSLGHTPLFQVMFAWQAGAPGDALPGLSSRSLDVDPGGSGFDLTLGLLEAEGGIELSLEYSTDLYEAPTAQRMLAHCARLLEHALEAPETPLGRLHLLDAAERRRVLVDFNATSAPFDEGATLVSLFDAVAARHPDALAIVARDRSLTFRELHARASSLAGHLTALGAGPESIVGVCLERDSDLLVSLLAVLYSGAAYLPLESSHPSARRAQLLARSGARLLLSRPALFSGIELDLRLVDPGNSGVSGPTAAPRPPLPGNVAYVLYTSGSTGEPKGVEVTHRNLAHAYAWCDRDFDTRPGSRWLAFTSVGFDVHALEILYPLTRGATVVLREIGPDGLLKDLARHGITHLNLPPAVYPLLREEPSALERFHRLSVLNVGGESIDPRGMELTPPGGAMFNCYGPTETTVVVSRYRLRPGGPLRIGKPGDRTRFYVLDPSGAPVPPGVPGELYVGGEGVSRGYRHRPDLTAERFVPDPFSPEPGARLYRTGDRVKWHADGTASFLGRIDFQVKIHGVRIELEEVEAALRRVNCVRDAAVLARQHGGDTRLLAFVCVEPGTSVPQLRQALSERLPDAMVPSRFIVLDALPLTSNDKVDRKALAALPLAEEEAASAGEPPRTPAEQLVAQLLSQLLGVERVGRDDDFFGLGGNSLLASQLASRLRRAFGIELPLTAVFSSPTVAQLASLAAKAPRAPDAAERLARRPRPSRLPASLVQERLWYALQLPQAPPFVITSGLLLQGPLDGERLERALAAVLERNETLRSTFHAEENALYVRAHEVTRPVLEHADLSQLPFDEALRAARSHLEQRAHQHLDLGRGPLYRFELLRLDAEGRRHVLALSISHLVIDGIGGQVLLEELSAAWREAGLPGAAALLPPREVQYADFALAQREPGYAQRLEQGLEAWKQALAGTAPAIDLPVDFPRRAAPLNANMRDLRLSLRSEDARGFKALARRENVSTFAAALALMQAWLHRLSGDERVVVAANISGRTLPETGKMVGFFTNLVPLGADLSDDPSFRTVLARARKAVEHASVHQEVPFKRIVDAVHPAAERTVTPLAQTLLMLTGEGRMELEGLSVTRLENDGVVPAYELILALDERPDDSLAGTVSYDSALFTEATARHLASALGQLLEAAVRLPDVPLSRLPLLSPEQREQVLAALSGPAAAVDPEACVHTLFERQVARTPEAPAVAQGELAWSYAELNARANRVAADLLASGLAPEERVGVVMEPSCQAMAVLLGILKAGGAYVPVDATWPEPRKQSILSRSGVRRLLVDAQVLEAHRLLADSVQVPPLPDEAPRDLGPGPRRVSSAQLAYIVFTSGSTGEPKGVMVQHASVVNHNLAIAERFGLAPGDRMLQFAPLSFDAAAEDLYPPLAVGATVVMKNGLLPAHSLSPWLERERISVISLPPTYIEEWVREMEAQGQRVPPLLHVLAPGGDVLKKETYEAWVRVGGGHANWVNVYGPTECTITSATCDIPGPEGVGTAPTFPIGRPVDNVRFYLLDERLEPVPPGLPGRVHIGGAALARGYLGAPDATARAFVPDPFSRIPGARMYHAGDLARLLPDGRLRFLGRADHQVKIRGFRVELSEIEGQLRRFPGVQEAVVLARESASGVKQLQAWVQAAAASVRPEPLREFVAGQLPAYMVPSAIAVLEQLPINANGKIDLRALPDPELLAGPPRPKEALHPAAYRTSLEFLLEHLWKEVLATDIKGVDENFFNVGGDSILAMRLLARIEDEVGVQVPMALLFQAPVLHEMAEALRELVEAGPPTSTLVRLSGPATPADAPPVFFLHPGDGEVYQYQHLVQLLEPRFRCYGVQAPETLSKRTFQDLDERVAAYVKDLRAVQPHGPYRLVAYSYGGYPALGVAAALEAAGEEVGLLAFFDVFTTAFVQRMAGVQSNPWHQMADEFAVLDDALKAALDNAGTPAERWDLIAARGRELGTLAPHAQGRDLARIWHVMGEVLVPEARRWHVPSVRSRLLLFRSAASNASGDETLGWGHHLPREQIEVVPFPGTHYTAIRPPDVFDLGPILLEALARVRG